MVVFLIFFHMSYLLSCFLLGPATFADCTSGLLNPNYLNTNTTIDWLLLLNTFCVHEIKGHIHIPT